VWEARKKHTPLHLAAMKGHADVVSILLKYGADPVAKTKRGETPFDLASKNESVLNALRAFLDQQQQKPSHGTINEAEEEHEVPKEEESAALEGDHVAPTESSEQMNEPIEPTTTTTNKRSAPVSNTEDKEDDEEGVNEEHDEEDISSENKKQKTALKKNKGKKGKKSMALSLSHLENDDPF
jgi:ankyrin repeat protein